MKDLYMSSSVYLECKNDLVKKLTDYVDNIYLDEFIEYYLIMGNAKVKINIVPGIINKMKELKEIQCGFSHSIAIINDISDNKAHDISKKYGIICIPAEDNIVDDKKFDVLKKGETIYVKQDNSNILSWNTALSNFKNLPCNAIIISDHYFYKQAKNASGNLKELIKNICVGDSIDILIICGDYSNKSNENGQTPEDQFEDQINFYIENIKDISNIFGSTTFNLEFVFIKKSIFEDEDLYNITHNRRVFTPYFVINAEHSIAAFGNKANKMQLVGIHSILNYGVLAEDGTTEYLYYTLIDNELNLLAERISMIINEDSSNLYRRYSITKGKEPEYAGNILTDIKNTLLADRLQLREGATCYGLDVCYCGYNDLTKVKITQTGYDSNKLKDTFVRAKRKEVIDVCDKIVNENDLPAKKCFENNTNNYDKKKSRLVEYHIKGNCESIIKNALKQRMNTNQKTNYKDPQICTSENVRCGYTNNNKYSTSNTKNKKYKTLWDKKRK